MVCPPLFIICSLHISNAESERMMATSTISASDEQSHGDILEHEEQEQNMEDFADYLVFDVE
jgi:hypothetical protein